MSFWDTSCLVKLYVVEPDSVQFEAHALASYPLTCSAIAPLELWATLRRKESEGRLAPGAAAGLHQVLKSDVANGDIILVPTDAVVEAEYESIVDRCHGHTPPIPIRTLDAIHLAAARTAGETEIMTTDKRLRDAALFEGFIVYPAP